jgi:hypothetical protein
MPRTPQMLLDLARSREDVDPGLGPESLEPTYPPEGANVWANVGAVCRNQKEREPLPAAAVAWGYEGGKGWLPPYRWPWGQYDPPEEAALKAAALKEARLALAKGGLHPDSRRDELPAPEVGVKPDVQHGEGQDARATTLPPGFEMREG